MSWAIVVAAGTGVRAGGVLPKQYQPLLGKTVIEHSVRALASHPGIDGLVVVLAAGDTHWPGWVEREGKPLRTAVGGAERGDSVLSGLMALPTALGDDLDVLVHDAARPLLSHAELDALLAADAAQGALLATPLVDTLKRADADQRVATTVAREGLWRALTPQRGARALLIRALRAVAEAGVRATDEAMALEFIGLRPKLVPGSSDNIKITTPADFALAEFLLQRRAAGATS
ncbi:MAG TPA: 2-C-methyl-D-erythritol 4-phosphate cytidylyltransferase [Chiayiivirga sp.]|nr:2-C-methyl-D-erythritol 4-phosphate cytidylyltransferase [Chiayiivirga sp.]